MGIHFTVCLLFYDTFLSYVLLVHASLLADITTDPVERASCNAWASGCSVFGSCCVFAANLMWNEADIGSFRIFCLLVGLASLVSFQISYSLLQDVKSASPTEEVVLHAPEASLKDF